MARACFSLAGWHRRIGPAPITVPCDLKLRLMNKTFIDYYRCPEEFRRLFSGWRVVAHLGHFRFGPECHLLWFYQQGAVQPSPAGELHDA